VDAEDLGAVDLGAGDGAPRPALNPRFALDVVAAAFGQLLRRNGVQASPAEVIEARVVLGLIGATNKAQLRAALRATCAKYAHEQAGFDRAFAALFESAAKPAPQTGQTQPHAQFGGGLPEELDLAEDQQIARYADYNERAAEVGDHFDTPESSRGFNPHKDDDDLSLTSAESQLSINAEEDSGKRGVTYTINVDRAASAEVGALSASSAGVVAGSLSWDDPASILAWLDSYDPRRVYGDDVAGGPLSATQLERLAAAVEAFVAALAGLHPVDSHDPAASGSAPGSVHADVDVACHEVLRRMRGAPRMRPRQHNRGRLDVRRTVRASMRADGVPFELVVRTPKPDKVRLLILVDVSLSVRPVTAFILRLAQAMRRRTHRCQVLAFVDRPVDVTEALLRSEGDDALAAVLAAPELDLEASSDYGQMLGEVLQQHGDMVTSRTSVLIVGDGRSNGLPGGVEHLREIRRRSHRLAWITPESSRYWRQATCAMDEYAPICNAVVVARDAEDLRDRSAELGNALR
jgi:uncharacterized protein with von Willebrand factor type A (vWA) domain